MTCCLILLYGLSMIRAYEILAMIRRHGITYAALRIEAVRISTEIFDDDTDPGSPRHLPDSNAPTVPSDAPETTRCDERSRIINLGGRT